MTVTFGVLKTGLLLPPAARLAGLVSLVNCYLAVLWFMGRGIGDRPLLMLGTLMIIVGIQMLIFGLLGEMIAAASYQPSEVDKLIRRIDRKTA